VPGRSAVKVTVTAVSLDYTVWLDLASVILAVVLLVRAARTGGLAMLRMMGGPADAEHAHAGQASVGGHAHGGSAASKAGTGITD
jgi:uncharacterized protein